MRIKDFLENELVDYATYSTYRAIASYIDGLKNAHRKVVYGIKKLNPKSEEKVSNLKGKIESISNYLHGDISGSIITLAKNYTGSNNLPLLTREGNFGTRFIPEPSATRYIYTQKEKYFDKIFRDDEILIKQEFEGQEIEPRYYVPVIPLLLINGSEGIATGFAQKILPRKLDEVINCLENILQDKDCNAELLPHFNGFEGEIVKVDKNKYEIRGIIKKDSKKIIIEEIPINYNYKNYLKVLNNLIDKKIIKKYEDLSDPKKEKFKFIVYPNKNVNLKDLKLVSSITENLTTIDENNRIRIFDNAKDILLAYIDIRLKHLKIRKEYKLNQLQKEIEYLKDKINFINAIIENKIIINKKSKEEIIEQAKSLNIKYIEEHLKMQLWNLTQEKIDELLNIIDRKEKEYKELLDKSEKQIWLEELNELKKLLYKGPKC